jgi:histone-lysine N-methyltransferase SETMAR
MKSRAQMSKTSISGVGSLQLVTWKFTMKKEAGDCQFPTRQSRRLNKSCVTIGGSLLMISRSTIGRTLTEKLEYRKVCARWVPCMLTEDHQWQRIDSSREFLQCYADENDNFSDSIVTGDETWAFHFTPETKQQSREWRHSSSPKPRKFKTTQYAGKVMATVFWDRKGVLLVDFMAHGTIINTDRYCETLKKLRWAIQNRRRRMLTKGICLLHDNARPHVGHQIVALLDQLDGTSSPTHPIVRTWHPVTTTCFLS